jgi:phenylalanyl-tRNA synthetase alpha chain
MAEEVDALKQLEDIQARALSALENVKDEASLDNWRITYLGRSSDVMQVFSHLPQFPKEVRPLIGQSANRVKQALETALAERSQALKEAALKRSLETERLDVTLPGRMPSYGRMHVVSRTLREITRVLGDMGFQVYRSPEVETDENNFELLNIPAHHPARDMWDTYHTIDPGIILRTHTSPGQVRFMREVAPEPVRVIVPGMVYRYEQTNASHEAQFNQVEGLAVGYHITFGDLKGTLIDFARGMFGEGVRTRIRPSYFPFTEPSAEMDVECFVCGGKGCAVCKGTGWLEVLGCGMVHPTVLENGGYDPSVFSGFAFGMGPERIAMLKYQIGDIRYFFANDVRFLEQFS